MTRTIATLVYILLFVGLSTPAHTQDLPASHSPAWSDASPGLPMKQGSGGTITSPTQSGRLAPLRASPCPTGTSLYFVDGSTQTVAGGGAADFVSTLSIQNPNAFSVSYSVTYYIEGQRTRIKMVGGLLGAGSTQHRSVNADVGPDARVSAQVSAPSPISATLVVSRSIGGTALASTSDPGQIVALPGTQSTYTYDYASGDDLATTDEYLVLLNPTNSIAHVSIGILPQSPIGATTSLQLPPSTLTVDANSRTTVPISQQVQQSGNTGSLYFGVVVSSDTPLASVRTEYFGSGRGMGRYAAATGLPGSTLFRQYPFASDVGQWPSTGGNNLVGSGSDISEIDFINPGPAASGSATVTVSFFAKNGTPINSQQVQVEGGTRETISLNDVVGTQSDVFSVVVDSDRNIFVEKQVSYGGDPTKGGTFAVTSNAGSPAGLTSVAFPYLDLTAGTGAISQTVFLFNPGPTSITVQATYAAGGQTQPLITTYTVLPNSITTVDISTDVATLPNGPLSAVFQVVSTGSGKGESFVASAQANDPQFTDVTSEQPMYPFPPPAGFAGCPTPASTTATDPVLGASLTLPPGWVQAPPGQYAPGLTLIVPAPPRTSEDNLRLAIQRLANYTARGGILAAANDLVRNLAVRVTAVPNSIAGSPAITLYGMPGAQPNVQIITSSPAGAYYDIIAFGGTSLAPDQQAALATLTFTAPTGSPPPAPGSTTTGGSSQAATSTSMQLQLRAGAVKTLHQAIRLGTLPGLGEASGARPALFVFWDSTAHAAPYVPRAASLQAGHIPAGSPPGYIYVHRPYDSVPRPDGSTPDLSQATDDTDAIDWPIAPGAPIYSQNNGTDATVLFSGYGWYGWTRYGQMVVIGYGHLGPGTWSVIALYADLQSTVPGIVGHSLGTRTPIGISGCSGTCTSSGMYPHVMAAEYTGNVQFASTMDGFEPYGGSALKPEPLWRWSGRPFEHLHLNDLVWP